MPDYCWGNDCWDLREKVFTVEELENWLNNASFVKEILPKRIVKMGWEMVRAKQAWREGTEVVTRERLFGQRSANVFESNLKNFKEEVQYVYDNLYDWSDSYEYDQGGTVCRDYDNDRYVCDRANDSIMSGYADYSDYDEMDPSDLSDYQYL